MTTARNEGRGEEADQEARTIANPRQPIREQNLEEEDDASGDGVGGQKETNKGRRSLQLAPIGKVVPDGENALNRPPAKKRVVEALEELDTRFYNAIRSKCTTQTTQVGTFLLCPLFFASKETAETLRAGNYSSTFIRNRCAHSSKYYYITRALFF